MSAKKPPDGQEPNVTDQVLRLVYPDDPKRAGGHAKKSPDHSSDDHPAAPHAAHSEEEDRIEVDERWLMTYADKMTLLCGLFIMLFAMSTMDKVMLERVKDSTQKSFGKPTAEVAKKNIEQNQIETIKLELEKTQQVKAEAEKKAQVVEAELQKMKEELKKSQQLVQENQNLQTQVEQLERKTERLEKTVKKTAAIPEPKVTPPPPDNAKKQALQQVDKLKREKTELERTVASVEQESKQAQNRIKLLQDELTKAKAEATNSSFVAFMMKWGTNDHDLDLRVEDPNGVKFDFKHRKNKSAPGTFVLDTRRGPGMEVWQSDRIVPGTYKFTYQFYNAYGNAAPCPVTGTLFSPKGSLDLPNITLDASSKREATFSIEINEHGQAQLK